MSQMDTNYTARATEENAKGLYNEIKEKGKDVEKEVKKYTDTLDQYIKRNPVKATVIAGIAGLILGKFLVR